MTNLNEYEVSVNVDFQRVQLSKNGDFEEVKRILDKSKYNELRAILTKDGTKLVAWDSDLAIHSDIAKILKIDINSYYNLYIFDRRTVNLDIQGIRILFSLTDHIMVGCYMNNYEGRDFTVYPAMQRLINSSPKNTLTEKIEFDRSINARISINSSYNNLVGFTETTKYKKCRAICSLDGSYLIAWDAHDFTHLFMEREFGETYNLKRGHCFYIYTNGDYKLYNGAMYMVAELPKLQIVGYSNDLIRYDADHVRNLDAVQRLVNGVPRT